MYRIVTTLAIALITSSYSFSQDLCFDFHETHALTCLYEDAEHLWLGTDSSGVIRFNKIDQSMTEWNPVNSSLPFNRVKGIAEYDGQLLISSDTSIVHFNDEIFDYFTDTIGGHLKIDSQGDLIIAGDFVFAKWDGNEVIESQTYISLVNESCPICDNVTDVAIDGDQMWLSHFGFYEFDIMQNNAGEWSNHDWASVSPDIFPIESWNEYNSIAAQDGEVLATSWAGIKRYYEEDWSLIHTYSAPTIIEGQDTLNTNITGVCFDQLEGYWIGSGPSWPGMESGRIAYSYQENWQIFSPLEEDSIEIRRLYPSPFENHMLYAITSAGLLEIDKQCLGITDSDEIVRGQLTVFPNPSTGLINIPGNQADLVEIIDLQGQLIFSESGHGVQQIDLSKQPAGVYILRFDSIHTPVRVLKVD